MTAVAIPFILIALTIGAFSSLLFALQWMSGPLTQASSLLLLTSVAFGGILLFLFLRTRVPTLSVRSGADWIFGGLALVFAGYWVMQLAKANPRGAWDAWAIWNLHARFLYRGGSDLWGQLFDPALRWSLNDYPLLLPALVEGGWTIAGGEQWVVPAVLASVFAVLTVGIVCSATCVLAEDRRGWVAGLILLATPSFLFQASAQMADIPLGLYILITVVLLQFADAWPQAKTPMLVLAGLSAGFTAWTKNEGLVFIVVVFVVRMAVAAARKQWREYGREALMIGLGAAPILLLIVAFKVFLATPNDIHLNAEAIRRMTTVERYPHIVFAFVRGFAGFGDTWGGMNPGFLLFLYLLFYGLPKKQAAYAFLIPALMLASYFLVYVITPYDLDWHLATSLDRLLLQLWPVSVFILAAVPRVNDMLSDYSG